MTPIAQAIIKLIAEMSARSAPVCNCLNKRTAISISSIYSCPTSNATDAHSYNTSIIWFHRFCSSLNAQNNFGLYLSILVSIWLILINLLSKQLKPIRPIQIFSLSILIYRYWGGNTDNIHWSDMYWSHPIFYQIHISEVFMNVSYSFKILRLITQFQQDICFDACFLKIVFQIKSNLNMEKAFVR